MACMRRCNIGMGCCPGTHCTWLRCRWSSQMSCPGRSARSCGPAAPARAVGLPPTAPQCRRRRPPPAPLRPRRHSSRLQRRVRAAHASLPARRRPSDTQCLWDQSFRWKGGHRLNPEMPKLCYVSPPCAHQLASSQPHGASLLRTSRLAAQLSCLQKAIEQELQAVTSAVAARWVASSAGLTNGDVAPGTNRKSNKSCTPLRACSAPAQKGGCYRRNCLRIRLGAVINTALAGLHAAAS